MQKFGKLGMIVLIIISIIAISAVVALYTIMTEERKKRLDVEEENSQLKIAKQNIERELDETVKIKDKLKADYEEQKMAAEKLAKQLEDEMSQREKLAAELSAKAEELARLDEQVKQERNTKLKLTNELTKVKKEHTTLQEQYEQLRMAKDTLEKKMLAARQEKGVELEKIVVKGEGESKAEEKAGVIPALAVTTEKAPAGGKLTAPPTAVEGQVLVVNKEFAFVVVNLGTKDGLNPQTMLSVFRGDKFLGKVQIERIYDTMSSAVILPEYKKEEIKEGDTVKLI